MPDSVHSDRDVSRVWASYLLEQFPDLQALFSSEDYGNYVAEYMHIAHHMYNQDRTITPISGTQIRNNPHQYRSYIPDIVRPYFMKKIVILGTESTGKSTLAHDIATQYRAPLVTEAGRDLVEKSTTCTLDDLYSIAYKHAHRIEYTPCLQPGIMIIDTDIHITLSYASYLFDIDMNIPERIMDTNKADLYLYLDNNAPYIQDGTRL